MGMTFEDAYKKMAEADVQKKYVANYARPGEYDFIVDELKMFHNKDEELCVAGNLFVERAKRIEDAEPNSQGEKVSVFFNLDASGQQGTYNRGDAKALLCAIADEDHEAIENTEFQKLAKKAYEGNGFRGYAVAGRSFTKTSKGKGKEYVNTIFRARGADENLAANLKLIDPAEDAEEPTATGSILDGAK